MLGLSTALSNALSGLVSTQSQTATVSRNITRASDEGFTRKRLELTTDSSGNVRAANIVRVAEKRLGEAVSTAVSTVEGQRTIGLALEKLSQTVGDVEADNSVAWGIGQLQNALADYESAPSSFAFAANAVRVACDLAQSISSASGITASVRSEADSDIAASITKSQNLLLEIEGLNARIISGGSDSGTVAELLDKRDSAVKNLSEEFGLRTIERPNQGIAIYTDSGVTLFDVSARTLSFDLSNPVPPGGIGNAVYIDGVQVTGLGSPMPVRTGRVAANVEIRDELGRTYQAQLDEVARILVTQFAEHDQGVPALLPSATGLFGYSGSPEVPSASMQVPGIASQIKVNPQFIQAQGGNPSYLRDGGANGAAYVYNSTSSAGFQDRLSGLIANLKEEENFDIATQLPPATDLMTFTSRSIGWIEQLRSQYEVSQQNAEASLQRTTDALAKKSGVNIDEEMATMLNLEKSYQAAAKIVTTVDQMLSTLMQMVR